MSESAVLEFKVQIPEEEVDRLYRKLKDTRLPPREIVPGAGEKYGPSYKWAKDLYNKWINDFDWGKVQDEINEYPHYLTTIENVKIHFVHARAEKPDAIPILLIHGWPGSFYEFSRVWGPLSHPKDPNDQAFNVVAPSLPGFCWSDWPPRSGWTLQDTAVLFDNLMKRLGYSQYMVQCGDWGELRWPALPEGHVRTSREQNVAARVDNWLENHLGYAICMRTRPHTIGIALNDNPMGILMWVGEKYNEAADPEKQKQSSWSDVILTTTMLYYFTDCIMPSALCYYENLHHEDFAEFTMNPENHVKVPFGVQFILLGHRAILEGRSRKDWKFEHDDGGHFAALENPIDIIQDLRDLVGQEWKR
ncbi:hypothetical protein N7450_004547 [Penicillium hetheringtonii]|uniref:Epoxide hydrolase N-terminal domain-containing protein n=1 Tax=Penicillium hetheringtonii TaxID=911720 RepID=A0AAD6DQZ6_9EURO|nr:hypothetical protein N7450_004547 [Penicillium hetheringtonii]